MKIEKFLMSKKSIKHVRMTIVCITTKEMSGIYVNNPKVRGIAKLVKSNSQINKYDGRCVC
jgi:hypothetical protein